jgi:hypothetical protein
MSRVLFDLVTQHGVSCPGQFAVWLDRLLATTNAHGRDLVISLPNTMMAADGDRLLTGAVEAGWIVRTGFEPNANQIFLGSGGIQGPEIVKLHRRKRAANDTFDYSPASWFNYSPGPKADEARAFVRAMNDNGYREQPG